MPKYRRIPEIIEAVEFKGGRKETWPPGVTYDPDGYFVVWNNLHKTYIKLQLGDYIRVDKENDRYPIDRQTFMATYEFWSS